MTGLLVKDLKLMMSQKNSLLMIGAMAVVIAVSMKDPNFVITYLTFIGVMYSMNTLSYDEFDNGNAFLFSLPITRKGYVIEKYTFGLLGGGLLWLTGVGLSYAAGVVRGNFNIEEMLLNAAVALPLMLFLLSFLLPVELKFGAEKARIMIIVIAGILFGLGVAVVKAGIAMDLDLLAWTGKIEENPKLAAAAVITATVIALGISCRISIGIMNKKEF